MSFLEELRNERRKEASRRVFWVFLGIFLILAGTTVLLNAPLFQVTSLRIVGSEFIADEIAGVLWSELKTRNFFVLPSTHVLFVPEKRVAQSVQMQFPEIEDVDVSRNIFGVVEVSVSTRRPWIVVCREERGLCFYVSSDGTVYSESPHFSGSALVKIFDMRGDDIYPGSRFLSEEKRVAFSKVYEEFENYGFTEISKVSILKQDRMEVVTDEGWKAIFDLRANANEMLENLRTAITVQIKDKKKDLDYIDLRFGNKLFFKFK